MLGLRIYSHEFGRVYATQSITITVIFHHQIVLFSELNIFRTHLLIYPAFNDDVAVYRSALFHIKSHFLKKLIIHTCSLENPLRFGELC